MNNVWADVVFGVRLLKKAPAFAIAAVLTLALGVGVNTAIFSVVNAFLLRPLPVPGGDRLVVIAGSRPATTSRLTGVSAPDLEDYRELTSRAFEDVAGYTMSFKSVAPPGGRAEWVLITEVTGNYFSTLGVEPAAGRLIRADEVRTGIPSPIAVLGYRTWQRRFGGDPSIVGTQVTIFGRAVTIVGVTPAEFFGTMAFSDTEVYLPLTWDYGWPRLFTNHAIGRLRTGVSIDQAQPVMASVATQLAADRPDDYAGVAFTVVPEPLARPEEDQARWNGMAGGITLALVALVLGVATVNVVNLVLARNVARRREMAVRAALGAGRARLVRQLLTEAMLLATVAGGIGLALGMAAARALSWIQLPDQKPARLVFDIDGRVLAYSACLALVTAVIVGLAPAFQTATTPLNQSLRDGVGRATGRAGFRRVLIASQIAACFLLLVAAGLFWQSLTRAERVDLGFQPAGILNVGVSAAQLGYAEAEGRQFFDRVAQDVRRLPGVEEAAFAQRVPLGYVRMRGRIEIEGRPRPPEERPLAGFNLVTPEYFPMMAIPMVRGRSFDNGDDMASPQVAVINLRFADMFWPGDDPIGRRFRFDGPDEPWIEVVGVTTTGKYESFSEDPWPFVYMPLEQRYSESVYLHVRTSMPPEALIPTIERTIERIAPDVALYDVMSMERSLDGGMGFFLPRLVARFVAILGFLALALAVIGVYGVVSYSAAQRTHEMGVRSALGARPGHIARLVMNDGVRMIVVGLAAGVGIALIAAPAVGRFLFGVSARDPMTLAVVAPLLAIAALFACAVPAARAARVDPIVALRNE